MSYSAEMSDRSASDAPDASSKEHPSADEQFFSLTPERVLDAVEAAGFRCRPVCYPLNSFENRVYEIELVDRRRLVAKFYRPGRWSGGQIREEHALLAQLVAAELPVVPFLELPSGGTLGRIGDIWYGVSDRRGGRAPDELDDAGVERLGTFVGRMHAVCANEPFRERPTLDVDRYVRRPLAELEKRGIHPAWRSRYRTAALELAELADLHLEDVVVQRIHADLHLGNVLFRDGLLHALDFDDAATGPPVQDVWLANPGRDAESERRLQIFLDGYERFRRFDRSMLRLIELLRAMRLVRYAGWLAKRWDDPAFRLGWPDFGSDDYWRTETTDLEEQLRFVRRGLRGEIQGRGRGASITVATTDGDPEALTNKDYFWDWEGD
ncbi:MAG: serine/threonine protein kinase [Acidobacteriota bacterium]